MSFLFLPHELSRSWLGLRLQSLRILRGLDYAVQVNFVSLSRFMVPMCTISSYRCLWTISELEWNLFFFLVLTMLCLLELHSDFTSQALKTPEMYRLYFHYSPLVILSHYFTGVLFYPPLILFLPLWFVLLNIEGDQNMLCWYKKYFELKTTEKEQKPESSLSSLYLCESRRKYPFMKVFPSLIPRREQ